MSLYHATVPPMSKMLKNLLGWLSKAAAHAETKKFDVAVLLTARLAPDQFPLIRQIQSACDAAKFAAARTAGKDAPSHPDTEQTMDEIRRRIEAVIAYLETFTPEEFVGVADRHITLPFMPGKTLRAADYVNGLAIPNFYFHITTAYAILRHNGVDVGKMDFIGGLELHDAT